MTDDTTHPCPKEGCPERIPFGTMACRIHWYGLPNALRNWVNRCWRNGDIRGTLEARKEVVRVLNSVES